MPKCEIKQLQGGTLLRKSVKQLFAVDYLFKYTLVSRQLQTVSRNQENQVFA